jgi:hypothetical protein
MKNSMFVVMGAAVFLTFATGCSNTVRYMTASQWMNTGGAGAPAAGGEAPAAGGEAPAAAAEGASGRTLYLTFWEGSCSSGVLGIGKGCSLGDSKIKRCSVKADNSMACIDEAEATRAFKREQE